MPFTLLPNQVALGRQVVEQGSCLGKVAPVARGESGPVQQVERTVGHDECSLRVSNCPRERIPYELPQLIGLEIPTIYSKDLAEGVNYWNSAPDNFQAGADIPPCDVILPLEELLQQSPDNT